MYNKKECMVIMSSIRARNLKVEILNFLVERYKVGLNVIKIKGPIIRINLFFTISASKLWKFLSIIQNFSRDKIQSSVICLKRIFSVNIKTRPKKYDYIVGNFMVNLSKTSWWLTIRAKHYWVLLDGQE